MHAISPNLAKPQHKTHAIHKSRSTLSYSLLFLPQRYRLVPVAQLTRLVKTIY